MLLILLCILYLFDFIGFLFLGFPPDVKCEMANKLPEVVAWELLNRLTKEAVRVKKGTFACSNS